MTALGGAVTFQTKAPSTGEEGNFIKMKNLCSMKDNIKRMRRPTTNWEKIFDKGLLSKIIERTLKTQQ